jgi:hypothetical protein
MHTTLKQYSRVQSTTNYEGNELDLGDGDGVDVEADGDVDGDASPYAKEWT